MSKAINKERKQIIQQVVILALFCIFVIIGGRILSGNRFKMTIAMADWNAAETVEDIQISWENDRAMKVSELSVRDGKDLVLVLEPDGPGDYELNIAGKDGRTILYDELHVDPLGTTYSMQSRNFTGDNAVVGGVTLFFLGLAAIALTHFLGFKGPRLYSYDAIWACGGGIFCAVTGLNFLNIFLRRIVQADAMWMRYIYETFSLSGWIFMLITLPALLVFSLLMIISNIALLRHESFRVQNILGLGIGLLMIVSELVGAGLLLNNFSGSEMQLRIYYVLSSVYFTIFTYFECILMGSVICGLRAAKHVPAFPQDYILILGCGFRKDGTLPPLLRGRVDKAIEFWREQIKVCGKEAILIPSGGQGGSEPMPEAEAMGRYLRECGIPERVILQEDQSRNTYQNMAFSKKLIEEREGGADDKNVIFVTTNYHVFRSGVWAGLAGLRAEGLGSKTKWWFWPNAFVRECVGLLANRIVPEAVCLVILIAIFGGIATLIV